MRFVKIGQVTLNIAQIAKVTDISEGRMTIRMIDETHDMGFSGDNAKALREFFTDCVEDGFSVTDITPEPVAS